jgi:hypothetical protein
MQHYPNMAAFWIFELALQDREGEIFRAKSLAPHQVLTGSLALLKGARLSSYYIPQLGRK